MGNIAENVARREGKNSKNSEADFQKGPKGNLPKNTWPIHPVREGNRKKENGHSK